MTRTTTPSSLTHTQAARAAVLLALAIPFHAHPTSAQPANQSANPPANDSAASTPNPADPIDLNAVSTLFRDPLQLQAHRAATWTDGPHQYAWLTDNAQVALANHGFDAQQALVRITGSGQPGTARQLAIVLQNARSVALDPFTPTEPNRPADASPVATAAPQLLITAATTAGVQLQTDARQPLDAPPTDDPFVAQALDRLARLDATPTQPISPPANPPVAPPLLTPEQQAQRDRIAQQIADRRQRLTAQARDQAGPPADLTRDAQRAANQPIPDPGVLPVRGVVSYAPGSVVIDRGDDETVVSLLDGVTLLFEDFSRQRAVTLKAQRAVLFLKGRDTPEPIDNQAALSNAIDAGDVRGVYLEDNAVITDGDYTVRAPRVYYDLASNRAILLEAVLFTYDLKRQVPLYLRADVLRQSAARSFTAQDATFTTSEFAEPHLALAASRITVGQYETPDGTVGQSVDAANLTARVNGLPVLWFPRFAARGTDTPLRSVRAGYSSKDGLNLRTAWDAFALLGKEPPQGVDAELNLDFKGEHGPGIGVEADYDRTELNGMSGSLTAYALLLDHGEDEIARRQDIEHDGQTRSVLDFQHRQALPNGIDISAEAGYVSDETFLEEFFPNLAEQRKPFETSLYLNRRDGQNQLTALIKTDVNDFLPQTTTLQSIGYTVDRLPEVQYLTIGTPLLDGRVTWYSHNAAAVLSPRFGNDTPADRGFTNQQSLDTFGFNNNTSFEQAADAAGFPTDRVLRADSRQEFALPLHAGAIHITPFAVARFTAYDDGFEQFNGDDDAVRLWGQIGTRLSTELHRTYASVESRTFDLDGLRHVLEPNATLAFAESSLGATELPTFDEDVESLTRGGTFKLGLNQTFQTRRGGLGRQRTVDWVRINSALVFQTQDEQNQEALARFVDYRPEFSRGGDHAYTELLIQLSDVVGAAGEITYDLEENLVAQWRTGLTLQHSPRLRTSVSYEEIDPLDSALLNWALTYQLTTKYAFAANQTLDFSGNERRQLNLALERQFPRVRFRVTASFDQLDDEQSVGLLLIPDGWGGRGLGSGLFN